MIIKLLNWPLIIFVLLLILLLNSFFGIYSLSTSIDDTDSRLYALNLASNISSYVKRAEGHLLMYLILNDKTDRDKFFSRMDSLEDNIEEIIVVNSSNMDMDMYLDNREKMLFLGNRLIGLKYKNPDLSFEQYQKEIREFHEHSSSISKAAVEFVALNAKHQINKKDYTHVFILLSLLGVACIVLIVLLIKKRSKELTLSRKIAHELDKISNTDQLTDIGNRRSFDAAFMREWQRSIRDQKPIGLLLFDIDCFKLFNDNYGHIEGDNCLRKVAQTLRSCMKRPGDSVWRYGGEEFAAILPGTDEAISVAENCKKAVELLNIQHKYSIVSDVVTISIGYSICTPNQKSNQKQFIECVDKALYRAKETGRNKVCSDFEIKAVNVDVVETIKDIA